MSTPTRFKPENALRKSEFRVDTCSLDQASRLITDEHYAGGCANTATFRHGLYRESEWPLSLVGAAVWIPPTRGAAAASWDGDPEKVLALSRLALEPDLPKNAATFLLGRSTRLVRQDRRWRCLITYADEWQGHEGTIYLAAGWEYVGMTKPERTYVDSGGRLVARKAGPKTRTHADMLALGFTCLGLFAKRKFRKLL